MTKADHELQIFREFAELADLPVDPTSIRSEVPPRPDISCSVSGNREFFELTRLADQEIADDVGSLLVRARKTGQGDVGSGHWYSNRDILRAAVERKTLASYETCGAPLSLLLYCDGVFHALGSLELFMPVYKDIRERYQAHWHGLWLYDRNRKLVL